MDQLFGKKPIQNGTDAESETEGTEDTNGETDELFPMPETGRRVRRMNGQQMEDRMPQDGKEGEQDELFRMPEGRQRMPRPFGVQKDAAEAADSTETEETDVTAESAETEETDGESAEASSGEA